MATSTTSLLLLLVAILLVPTAVLAGDDKKDRYDYGYDYGGGYDYKKPYPYDYGYGSGYDNSVCSRVQPSVRYIQYGDYQYKTISLRGLPKKWFYAFTAIYQNQITLGDGQYDRCPDGFIDKKTPWLARIRAETCPEHEDRVYRLYFAAYYFQQSKCMIKKDDKKYDDTDYDWKKDDKKDVKKPPVYDDGKKDDKKDVKKDDKKYLAGLYGYGGYDDYGYDYGYGYDDYGYGYDDYGYGYDDYGYDYGYGKKGRKGGYDDYGYGYDDYGYGYDDYGYGKKGRKGGYDDYGYGYDDYGKGKKDDYGYGYDSYGKGKKDDYGYGYDDKKGYFPRFRVYQCYGYVDVWVYGSQNKDKYSPGGLYTYSGPWYDSSACSPNKNNNKSHV